MARDKMFDPAFQKSFTEAIYKENKTRIQWHLEHGARLRRAVESCAWDDQPDDDDEDFVPEEEVVQRSPTGELEEKTVFGEREKEMLRKIGTEKEKKPPAVMKPVPLSTKKLLYKGLSHHEEGRYKYLKSRYKKSPENKFYFPICCSWEYGWTYGQEHELKCPYHGRRQIMKTSFFRPNDPQLKPRD